VLRPAAPAAATIKAEGAVAAPDRGRRARRARTRVPPVWGDRTDHPDRFLLG